MFLKFSKTSRGRLLTISIVPTILAIGYIFLRSASVFLRVVVISPRALVQAFLSVLALVEQSTVTLVTPWVLGLGFRAVARTRRMLLATGFIRTLALPMFRAKVKTVFAPPQHLIVLSTLVVLGTVALVRYQLALSGALGRWLLPLTVRVLDLNASLILFAEVQVVWTFAQDLVALHALVEHRTITLVR